ncbi:hypothetical protein ACIBK9_25895 [Nonomuraea sp. NPDC050227]|uniref:hypothetical protein n=1 Tax=Nonomuraea sp. NPDC050227 TaxID=3364360 RepID=UPI0037B876F4
MDPFLHQADLLPLVTLQPPVRLLPADDLAAVVRATPVVHDLLRLASAAGAQGAARPEQGRLWGVAEDSRLIDVRDGTATTGPAVETLTSGPADDVLDTWGDILYSLFSPEADAAALDAGTSTLLMLLSHRDALPVAEIPELTDEAADELAWLRLIRREGSSVSLTPLGTWSALDLFKTLIGQDIPVHGGTAGADAPTLLRALRTYDDDERAEEVRVWLGGRDPARAAEEIADVLLDVSPLSRAVGLTVLLEDLGRPGQEIAAALREVPRLGALIRAREKEDHDVPPAPVDVAWVYADMTVAAMEIGGPAESILQLSGNLDVDDVLSMLGMMTCSDHPYTTPMLRFLIEHHPAPRVASAARVALQRWRGVHVRPPGERGRLPRKPRKPGKTAGAQKRRRR